MYKKAISICCTGLNVSGWTDGFLWFRGRGSVPSVVYCIRIALRERFAVGFVVKGRGRHFKMATNRKIFLLIAVDSRCLY